MKDLYIRGKEESRKEVLSAVMLIQRVWRQLKSRRRFENVVKDCVGKYGKAITLIQKYCRGYLEFQRCLLPKRLCRMEKCFRKPRERIETDSQIKISYLFRTFKRRQTKKLEEVELRKRRMEKMNYEDFSFQEILKKKTNKSDFRSEIDSKKEDERGSFDSRGLLPRESIKTIDKYLRRSSMAPVEYDKVKNQKSKFNNAGYLKPTKTSAKKSSLKNMSKDSKSLRRNSNDGSISGYSQAENSSCNSQSRSNLKKPNLYVKKLMRRKSTINPLKSPNRKKKAKLGKQMNTSKAKVQPWPTIKKFKKTSKLHTIMDNPDYRFTLAEPSPIFEGTKNFQFNEFNP